jgi:hypothetical protein
MMSLFVGADSNADGNLDFEEFITMIKVIKVGRPRRESLKMFAELTLNRSLDPTAFVKACRKYNMLSLELGPTLAKKKDKTSLEVFNVLNAEWTKIEDIVHELLVVLEGSRVGEKMDEAVDLLKKLLNDKLEAEQAWLVYRKVVAEFTSAVKNRTPPEPPPVIPEEEENLKAKKKGGKAPAVFKKEK